MRTMAFKRLFVFHSAFKRSVSTSRSWLSSAETRSDLQAQLEKTVFASSPGDKGFIRQLWKTLKSDDNTLQRDDDIQRLDITPEILASEITRLYHTSLTNSEKKRKFFDFLTRNLGPCHNKVLDVSKQICDIHQEDRRVSSLLHTEATLRASLRPAYLELFALIPRMEGGLRTLISLREDLLSIIKQSQDTVANSDSESLRLLQDLDGHLRSLLSQWFSLGFLDLQRITWESPCDIIEKVSEYEAVHSVRHWKDIKHRVGPYRRVFTFTHRSMPREPIIILHTALVQEPSNSVQALLKLDNEQVENVQNVRTAVFYSISAAHKGLSGIELGNSLILQVVNELKREFPELNDFVTLSPIPGFRKWLESHLTQNIKQISESCRITEAELARLQSVTARNSDENYLQMLKRVLADNSWVNEQDGAVAKSLEYPLLALCARYLIQEKRRSFSYNPVAHFHIRNGASVWRLNWLADVSPRGMNQSFGIMTNYRYNLMDMVNNNIRYLTAGEIKYSNIVSQYLEQK